MSPTTTLITLLITLLPFSTLATTPPPYKCALGPEGHVKCPRAASPTSDTPNHRKFPEPEFQAIGPVGTGPVQDIGPAREFGPVEMVGDWVSRREGSTLVTSVRTSLLGSSPVGLSRGTTKTMATTTKEKEAVVTELPWPLSKTRV
ncbi:hypothetical protein T440DRAFT_477737 [Plenodomus tracheiphilus IPT5]|uniref:Uncharacterized protein n=1 Tax=Plenodomus tracheiphilus IPT5 TaxID=1408161 RepID=A0A6A7BDM9_9PLEO|nr:hypothetical protein T440DRAFT_477737 [Plenodomus tracheiphilus IPT5]